ncbi:hypothetical protein M406DRAFT_354312 [Cryphonectria parasitica EP155]|uniref:G domain-containing protein n=1 Tax=Cryphonectria parasitica (strain ATCC 38755 / EP155) TaxID=660469 RepID=A0A9P5CTY3_CRYP1|nr:uncharacterized protein M406DRAFT_354312 [Cryphonectria parasitica EP155]KAF3770177.1 hypothetical protein M406DRAFT_354312 [Cryphonectria parasitica EP155]
MQIQELENIPTLPTLIIGVMGVTGAGKSTFIQRATGTNEGIVGHSLVSCTQQVTPHYFAAEGYNFVLVDTPGFNDTYKSDAEVLKELANYLELTYKQKTKLAGIVYLHRITDVRMDGGAMRNLKMFRKLCGEKPMRNVVIASTFWGTMSDTISEAHESELISKSEFWGDMISHGARTQRFTGNQRSALDILLSFADHDPETLQLQRELVDERKSIGETEAGCAVNEELLVLEEKYKQELKKIQQEAAEALAERDQEMQEVLEKERAKMERKIERIHTDQELLREDRREEIRRLEMEHLLRFDKMQHDYQVMVEQHLKEAGLGQKETLEQMVHLQEDMAELKSKQAAP